MTFAKRILNFRSRHGLTQAEMADVLGVTLNMVFRYEHGTSKPRPANMIRIEKILEGDEQNVQM